MNLSPKAHYQSLESVLRLSQKCIKIFEKANYESVEYSLGITRKHISILEKVHYQLKGRY